MFHHLIDRIKFPRNINNDHNCILDNPIQVMGLTNCVYWESLGNSYELDVVLRELEGCLQQVASRGPCSAVYVLESRKATVAGNRLWIKLPSRSPCVVFSFKGTMISCMFRCFTGKCHKCCFLLFKWLLFYLYFNLHKGNIRLQFKYKTAFIYLPKV